MGLTILGAGLGRLQTSARDRNRVDPVGWLLQKLILTPAMPLSRTFLSVAEFGTGVARARSLYTQNKYLQSQLIALQSYDQRVDQLEQEIAQLRSQLSLPNYGRERINLDVIGISQSDGFLILDGGRERGIRPDLPVVNGDGIVGIVQTVGEGECRAAILSSYGLKVGGLDASRKPPEDGLVSGLGGSTLTMLMFVPKAPAASGDMILTSGQSKNIPGGLVIGRVISVEDDPFYGTRRLTLDPAVDLGAVHEVQVLK